LILNFADGDTVIVNPDGTIEHTFYGKYPTAEARNKTRGMYERGQPNFFAAIETLTHMMSELAKRGVDLTTPTFHYAITSTLEMIRDEIHTED
jgi:hypothetical protein